jgi:hypothetical protein
MARPEIIPTARPKKSGTRAKKNVKATAASKVKKRPTVNKAKTKRRKKIN